MSVVLSYQQPPAPPSSSAEFDYHFEHELSRRLRRRFLWYCGITIVLSLLVLVPGLLGARPAPPVGPGGESLAQPPAVNWISRISTTLSLLMYVGAWALVWYRPMRRPTLLRLALWLYVLASIPGLIGTRITMQLVIPPDLADRVVEDEVRRRSRPPPATRPVEVAMPGIRIGTRPPPPATTQALSPQQLQTVRSAVSVVTQPPFIFAIVVPFLMLLHHTFACLFIPWTLRQSLAPAGVLLLVLATIVAIDYFGGGLPWWAAIAVLPVTALMFVPGSAWCWWRFGGIRRDIRLAYESERFRTLQYELMGARRILETALPPPRADGPVQLHYVYEPMRQIGGDLLFVFPPADSSPAKLSAVLLDVTGHGIAAALSVNRLIGELERLFAESPDATPADVLCALNRYVHFTMARLDLYVTAIALHVDADKGTLTYASGGHPTAYVRRADGRIDSLHSTTMLLGVVEGQLFAAEPVTIAMHPGDTVIAYTDGASEAAHPETHRLLGMEGVRTILEEVSGHGVPVMQWPRAILQRVAEYRNAPPADDTLVVAVARM